MASILPNTSQTAAVPQASFNKASEVGLATLGDVEPIITKPLTKKFPFNVILVNHNGAGNAAYLVDLATAAPIIQNRIAQHVQHSSSVVVSNLRLHFEPSSSLAQTNNITVGWGVRSTRDPLAAFPSITECLTAPQGGQIVLALAGQWAYTQTIDINLEIAGITGSLLTTGIANTGPPIFRFFVTQGGAAVTPGPNEVPLVIRASGMLEVTNVY